MYRAPSGALVFAAGTVQWSWGLADVNAWESETTEPANKPADPNMEQATVNLFAEMGVQPGSLLKGLVPASKSTNTTPPTSTITSPAQGATFQDGSAVTITGTATAAGEGVVAGVEVSTNGGSTWHPATLTTPAEQTVKWTYTWAAHGNPTTTIKSRAVDDSANLETPSAGVTVNVSCPCSLWGSAVTPPTPDSGDPSSLELGMKFTSDVFGTVTGVRFYKSAANTGTHVGSLWSESGTLLASATFTGETASGWQQVNFSTPVQISPHTTYVVSYLAPNGHYAEEPYYFYNPPPTGGNMLNSPPLHAVPASDTTTNGLYAYTSTPTFPTGSFNATNYWVDPVFTPAAVPGPVTEVSATPQAGAATVSWTAPSSGGGEHLHRHPLHRLHRAVADHRERLPAGNLGHDLGPHAGHDLHVHGAGVQPERRRPGLGTLQPGRPAGDRAALAAARGLGESRDQTGARHLESAEQRRRKPAHGVHGDPLRRLDRADRGARERLGDLRDGDAASPPARATRSRSPRPTRSARANRRRSRMPPRPRTRSSTSRRRRSPTRATRARWSSGSSSPPPRKAG